MAGKQTVLLLALVVIAAISGISSAATHIVGGRAGWTVPTNPNMYSSWANGETFAVGDVLGNLLPLLVLPSFHNVCMLRKSANSEACRSDWFAYFAICMLRICSLCLVRNTDCEVGKGVVSY